MTFSGYRVAAQIAATLAMALRAGTAAAQQQAQANAVLTVNFSLQERYSTEDDRNGTHAKQTLNLTGSTHRSYIADIDGKQLVDLSEMTPQQMKKANAAAPGDTGQLVSTGNVVIASNGSGLTASQTYQGSFTNGASSSSLLTDGGYGLRLLVNADHLSGICETQSRNISSHSCQAGMGIPSAITAPDATGPSSGKLSWTADILPGDPKAAPGAKSEDAMITFLTNPPWQGLKTSGNAGTGYTLTFSQTRQYSKTLSDGGTQTASRKLQVEAEIRFKEIKCLLNEGMIRNAFKLVDPRQGAMQNLQVQQSTADSYSFQLTQPPIGAETNGYTINGTANLSHQTYTVKATLTAQGATGRAESQSASVDGCMATGSDRPGLDLAFTETVGNLIGDYWL